MSRKISAEDQKVRRALYMDSLEYLKYLRSLELLGYSLSAQSYLSLIRALLKTYGYSDTRLARMGISIRATRSDLGKKRTAYSPRRSSEKKSTTAPHGLATKPKTHTRRRPTIAPSLSKRGSVAEYRPTQYSTSTHSTS